MLSSCCLVSNARSDPVAPACCMLCLVFCLESLAYADIIFRAEVLGRWLSFIIQRRKPGKPQFCCFEPRATGGLCSHGFVGLRRGSYKVLVGEKASFVVSLDPARRILGSLCAAVSASYASSDPISSRLERGQAAGGMRVVSRARRRRMATTESRLV